LAPSTRARRRLYEQPIARTGGGIDRLVRAARAGRAGFHAPAAGQRDRNAPLVMLDRNERVWIMGKFRAHCGRSWVANDSGSGVITRTAESVFGALLYLKEKYSRVFPSLEGLAHLVMCCKQSVVIAIADSTRQITNAYRVHDPTSGLGLVTMTLFATESNSWTPSTTHLLSEERDGARRATAPRKNPGPCGPGLSSEEVELN
jgi:hypothetical protein